MGLTPARALRGVVLSTIAVTSTLLVVTALPSVASASGQAGEGDRPRGRGDQADRGLRGGLHLERRQQRHQLQGQARRRRSGPRWTATPSPRPPGPPHTARPAGTVVRVQVTPYRGTRKGSTATISKTLPDLTAPTGTSRVSWTAVNGDGDADRALRRPVAGGSHRAQHRLGRGRPASSPGPAAPLTPAHLPGRRRRSTARGSSWSTRPATPTSMTLHAVVIGDDAAPTGTFTAGPAAAWSPLTSVQLTQTSLADDFSKAADVPRLVDWGDGSRHRRLVDARRRAHARLRHRRQLHARWSP